MRKNNIEKTIREDWFKEHKAELTQQGDLQVLEWYKPNTSFYYCRYVFDGSRLYVSGDMGEAVFRFTEKATLEKISKYDLHYFHGKLSAFCEEKYSFDSDRAIERIKEEIEQAEENRDIDDDGKEEISDRNKEINGYICTLTELIVSSKECSYKDAWDYEVNQQYDYLTDYDTDVAEWIFKAGDVIPSRIHGYLIGLLMALEQLKKQ